ncbi:MAG: hypothetical protein IT365_00190 [Candidatus Hydrogenedentes bacterium]|nr:hypothetical protein [Candidatus Hydrogenedentota bacterium]
MPRISRRVFLAGSASVLTAAAVEAANSGDADESTSKPLRAGVAVRDITPEAGIPMWGYSGRKGPATGTLDPLMARALVLAAGEECLALVTLDLGRVPLPSALARIRKRVARQGVKHAIFCASHTHHGPVMEVDDQPYVKHIEHLIGDAIEEAAGHLQEAQVGWGTASIDISHNRRFIKDGRCFMMWRNADRIPTQPVDHEAGIIRVDTTNGTPLAALVHYACHPVVLGTDNLEYSADWPGEMARHVKEGAGAECFFLQGGSGDINPYLDKTPIQEGGVDAMRATGREAGQVVLAALAGIQSARSESPSISYAEDSVEIGTRWDFSNLDLRNALKEKYGSLFDKYIAPLKPDLEVKMSTLLIDRTLALSFMPGELFVQFQLDLKKNSPLPATFLCGYADDFYLYFPTIKDAAIGGYGASTTTFVGVGAGEKLVRQAALQAGRLAGIFPDLPRPEDFVLHEYPPVG